MRADIDIIEIGKTIKKNTIIQKVVPLGKNKQNY